jgi:hypothetical protein
MLAYFQLYFNVMEKIKLELKKRNRDFGIITWPHTKDFEIKTLFKDIERVNVEFGDKVFNNRKVDSKYRRISFGKKRMTSIKSDFIFIELSGKNLKVSTI